MWSNKMITIENEIVAWASSGIEGSRGSTENSGGTLNWIGGWELDGLMDVWMDGKIDKWMDEYMNEWLN